MQSEHIPKGLRKLKNQKIFKETKYDSLKIKNNKNEELEYYNNKIIYRISSIN